MPLSVFSDSYIGESALPNNFMKSNFIIVSLKHTTLHIYAWNTFPFFGLILCMVLGLISEP